MQLRTRLQHLWAAAVEIFDAFMGENFKSSRGSQAWLDFFALVSSAFAHKEKQPVIPEHADMSREELLHSLQEKMSSLHVLEVMQSFSLTDILSSTHKRESGHALLVFDAAEKLSTVRQYTASEYEEAYSAYIRAEEENRSRQTRQVVLVKMDFVVPTKVRSTRWEVRSESSASLAARHLLSIENTCRRSLPDFILRTSHLVPRTSAYSNLLPLQYV